MVFRQAVAVAQQMQKVALEEVELSAVALVHTGEQGAELLIMVVTG
jgi:hypothetical protein